MRIEVQQSEGRAIRILLPSGLVFNGLTARIAARHIMPQNGVKITGRQAAALVKELNRFRKRHPEWVLVEADSQGNRVKIKL